MSPPDASSPAKSPPLPLPDDLTRFFWEGLSVPELRIQRCASCGKYIHYPKPVCRFCHGRELAGEAVSGRATLYSWTLATQAFHPFWADRLPYIVATVELVEQPGLMFTSQVVECAEEALRPGLPLEVVFESLTSELTLPFFRPSGGGASR